MRDNENGALEAPRDRLVIADQPYSMVGNFSDTVAIVEFIRGRSRRVMQLATISTAVALLLFPWIALFALHGGHIHAWTSMVVSAGLSAFALLSLQLVLSAHSPVLDRLFGLDRLVAAHRIIGPSILALVAVHSVMSMYTFSPFTGALRFMVPPFGETAPAAVAVAAMALAAGVGIFRASLSWRRETWRRVHAIGYIALPAALAHAMVAGNTLSRVAILQTYLSLVIALPVAFLASKALRRYTCRRTPLPVVSAERLSDTIVRLRFHRPANFTFSPGQFLLLATDRSDFQPFTISSPPDAAYIEVTARILGDFTRSLAHLKPGNTVAIDGPYGRFTLTWGLKPRDGASVGNGGHAGNHTAGQGAGAAAAPAGDLMGPARPAVHSRGARFIAGGIGITPFLSMLWSVPSGPLKLIWTHRASDGPALADALEAACRTSRNLEIVHEIPRWAFSFGGGSVVARPPSDGVHIVPGRLARPGETAGGESASRQTAGDPTRGKVRLDAPAPPHAPAPPDAGRIYLCGPPGFMRAVRKRLRATGVRRTRILTEQFTL